MKSKALTQMWAAFKAGLPLSLSIFAVFAFIALGVEYAPWLLITVAVIVAVMYIGVLRDPSVLKKGEK